MGFFTSRKRRNEELLLEGVRVFSTFSTRDTFFREELVPFLAELQVAFSSGTIQTIEDAEAQVGALKALPPLQRTLCCASILHSVGTSIRKAGALGGLFCSLVESQGIGGCTEIVQDVLDREDQEQAALLGRALDTLMLFGGDFSRAQAVYLKGHLEYGVLGGSKAAFATTLRKALAILEQEADPALAHQTEAQRAGWRGLLAQL